MLEIHIAQHRNRDRNVDEWLEAFEWKTGARSGRQTEREDWIDIAKGIAILLVILGHTVWGIVRGAIFSFHMPLFFILSCVTFKLSVNNDQFISKTERAFRHLIIPAITLYILQIILDVITNFSSIEWRNYLIEKVNVFVFGSGVQINVMDAFIPGIGMIWFFIVLFIGRSLFDYLHLKLKNRQFQIVIIICTLAGIAFGKLQWLPLSFDIALAIMPFFYIGNYLKTVNMKNKTLQYGGISFGVWAVMLILCYTVKHSYMELACRRYTLFPFSYIGAIAATMFVGYLSTAIENIKIIRPIKYLGKNSMYMFWVHVMDYTVRSIWNKPDNDFMKAFIRIAVDIVLFLALVQFVALINTIKDNRNRTCKN